MREDYDTYSFLEGADCIWFISYVYDLVVEGKFLLEEDVAPLYSSAVIQGWITLDSELLLVLLSTSLYWPFYFGAYLGWVPCRTNKGWTRRARPSRAASWLTAHERFIVLQELRSMRSTKAPRRIRSLYMLLHRKVRSHNIREKFHLVSHPRLQLQISW